MKFEEYLQDKHAIQYVGLDDEMPDDFNDWLQELGVDEVIDYAEKWHNSEMRMVLEMMKETIIFRVECLGKNECDSVMFAINDIEKKFDKELEGIQ